MKVSFILFLFLAIIILISCKYGTDITVENKSDSIIDSIIVQSDFNKIKIKKLEKDELDTFFIDFKNSNHKGDGIFGIQLFNNRKMYNQQFGYFSNGVPSSNDFYISIYNDTIIIDRY